MVPAAATGLVLFGASYGMDVVMNRFGTSAWTTILSDMAIGLLGAAALFYYLTASYEKYIFESAKERMILIGEFNERIQEAMEEMAVSAMSDDRIARLRGLDDATVRIDDILSDFLTKSNSNGTARSLQLRVH